MLRDVIRCATYGDIGVKRSRDFHGSFHGAEERGGDGAPLFLYWWLIVRYENAGMDMLILDGTCRSSRGEVLPVFGFKEEARIFLRYGVSGALAVEGWRVRRSSGGELISALCGPCRYVGRVALDPLPHRVFGTWSGCACLSRNQFMERLQDRHPGKVGASGSPQQPSGELGSMSRE
jgi:hypothetical protein